MPTRNEWATAYFRQAHSDWTLFRELSMKHAYPSCHALHFLQMATEKLAKAYRFRDTTTSIERLLTCHTGFPRFLNSFLLSPQMKSEFESRHAQLESIRRDCQRIAEAIERLAPAVDREHNPQNVEYPWCHKQDGPISTPIDYGFPEVALLRNRTGRVFLNLILRAFQEFGP